MSSLVAGSPASGAANATSVTLGAAVQVGDVIVVEYCAIGGGTPTSTCNDSLGNTYAALQTTLASAGDTNIAAFASEVTVPGTPVISLGSDGLIFARVRALALRGLTSATPLVQGQVRETAANPMVVSLSPASLATGVAMWANGTPANAFTSFTLGATTAINDSADTKLANALGYLLDQAAGTYALGANFGTPDTNSHVVVLWFPAASVASAWGPQLSDQLNRIVQGS